MREFSLEELRNLAKCDLIHPDNVGDLEADKEEYLRKIGATDEDINIGDDLCPEEFWWYTSDLAIELARALLYERERKYDKLLDPIADIERELKQLKKAIKSNLK
jgi:hypothetical protein